MCAVCREMCCKSSGRFSDLISSSDLPCDASVTGEGACDKRLSLPQEKDSINMQQIISLRLLRNLTETVKIPFPSWRHGKALTELNIRSRIYIGE
jgi:hypothetical protein